MHFALPPRKTSQPPPFARSLHLQNAAQRRRQLQSLGYIVLGLATLYLIYTILFSHSTSPASEPTEIEPNPSIIIVTVFNEATQSSDFISRVRQNREDYASRHGYTNFFTNASTYDAIYSPSPSSWATVPALRHALTLHPQATYFWSLDAYSLITNPTLSLESHIFANLSSLMQRDIPVVPPDSVIRTFSHLTPRNVHLILSQDMDNLAHTSFILRNNPPPVYSTSTNRHPSKVPDEWALFLLDAWLDPLYRSYAFQKAEQHALEHIVQWHPTVLAKLALIPQRRFNSYNFQYEEKEGRERQDSMWQAGDFVVNLKGCGEGKEGRGGCEEEMRGFWEEWRRGVRRLEGGGGGGGA